MLIGENKPQLPSKIPEEVEAEVDTAVQCIKTQLYWHLSDEDWDPPYIRPSPKGIKTPLYRPALHLSEGVEAPVGVAGSGPPVGPADGGGQLVLGAGIKE